MTKRWLLVLGASLVLAGCPLEGDEGRVGPAGPEGPRGPEGPAGTSCWDLNENGTGDLTSEDIDQNGTVDVNDCVPGRAANAASQRQYFASFAVEQPEYLEVFRFTNFPDGEVIDPLQDGCSVWEWGTNLAGNAILTARDGYVIAVETYPVVYVDLSNVRRFGYDSCAQACLERSDCIGASYSGIDDNQGTTTAISCQLLGRFPPGRPAFLLVL